ncbi:hypothetical protein HMPREF9713_02852 [Myroides odoratimimus CCUG 12700]|uniref:DUF4929 family protein n=1 Tax=Myroides odoratimimus TaxID=76832 RepID=UPI000353DC46|nr:DUF4929 family protein [Myroides odoratimimus]EPH09515.1 hypothetical protein HMPREF9713_02852 [Myroides odoratimimus CCUG 12700]
MTHHLQIKYLAPIFIFLLAFASSCNKEDNELLGYTGENKIVLLSNSAPFIQDNGTDELLVDVHLVNAIKEDISLEFALDNHIINQQPIVALENNSITFKAGEKKGVLKIKSISRQILDAEHTVSIKLINNSSTLPLEKEYKFIITPIKKTQELTDKQIELLDGYKRKGLDLYPLMGEIAVETTINFPGEGNLETMYKPYTSKVKGYTAITLSDKSTPEQPILKMVSNPMGIENYLYQLFRIETIDDQDFWTQSPSAQQIMSLINLSATSKESFEVELDDINIDLKTRQVSYLSTLQDLWNDEYTAVPFQFKYSAWDRLKKLLDEGNPLAIENVEMGGSVNPQHYINTSDISEDDYGKGEFGNYRKTSAKLTETNLNFQFVIGHTNANDYILFTVEYKLQ